MEKRPMKVRERHLNAFQLTREVYLKSLLPQDLPVDRVPHGAGWPGWLSHSQVIPPIMKDFGYSDEIVMVELGNNTDPTMVPKRLTLHWGDWIIQHPDLTLKSCKQGDFHSIYQEIEE